ncbi:type I-F CRISPR-associated protein Csy2 [Vibrio casei]|uniref:type I-F CRISPR-associated protein Csy2 n=1 Tax=Vibrio casei TaxID=673372 RepID=UPI003F9E0963
MAKLKDLINEKNEVDRQTGLKKAFMPYSELIGVDGDEFNTLTILLNLSLSKPECSNWLDSARAKGYLIDSKHIDIICNEIKWLHSHNLKFPDCRVKDQRIIAHPLPCDASFISSAYLFPSLGWSHNSAVYKHTVWLLSTFIWQGEIWCLLDLIRQADPIWLKLLKQFGLKAASLKQLQQAITCDLSEKPDFPSEIDRFSKQVRFPWDGDYLSITPVVSHAIQLEIERLARDKGSELNFTTLAFPNSASIGNLCASVGGNMKALHYPLGLNKDPKSTFSASRNKTGKWFDDYQLTNRKFCKVLSHLCGSESLHTAKKQQRARHFQLRIVRKQIALWLLPLIELRDHLAVENEVSQVSDDSSVITEFLYGDECKIIQLLNPLNQLLQQTLQNNQYSSRYAYHPKLLIPLKQQLQLILKQLSKPSVPSEVTKTQENQEQYIHLSSLRVEDANAMSSPYLCGCLSLTAIWGFIHHYQRQFNQSLNDSAVFQFQSVAIFYRNEKIKSSAKLTEPSVLKAKRTISQVKRSTILPARTVDLEFDVVIKVQSKGCLSDHTKQLKASLPSSLGGGSLFQPNIHSKTNWLETYRSQTDLFYRIKSFPAFGAWLFPEEKQPTSFTELTELLSSDGELIPVTNGFHFLEHPVERVNSLTDLHVYAENTTGVAKCVNAIDVRFSGWDHFFKQAFWKQENNEATILIQKDKN